MRIVIFTHPQFIKSQSMPKYAKYLGEGMKIRGHDVEYLTAKAFFYKMPSPAFLKKWLGYIDQFIVFPFKVRRKIKSYPQDTLFVFADHALGSWISLAAKKKHVIHCHDFLAQLSALGEIPENPTSWSGQKYQAFIRKGYRKGCNFISISNKTRKDLHKFLNKQQSISEVVHNSLTRKFEIFDTGEAREYIAKSTGVNVSGGYLLHVGGNQWYKNRLGIIEIYNEWRKTSDKKLPLLLIGAPLSSKLTEVYNNSPYKNDIHLISSASDELIGYAYSGASLFLFPSLAEGFGWPIAEAMAAGTIVLTTNAEPMTEVAGDAAFLIERRPVKAEDIRGWAMSAAQKVEDIFNLSAAERKEWIEKGIENVKRFDANQKLDEIEAIYKKVLNQ